MPSWVTYDVGKDITEYYTQSGKQGEQILEATKPTKYARKAFTEIDTFRCIGWLITTPRSIPTAVIQARIELHYRLALPPACFLLASDRHSARHLVAQRRQVERLRRYGRAGVHLLDGTASAPMASPSSSKLPVGVAMWIPNGSSL